MAVKLFVTPWQKWAAEKLAAERVAAEPPAVEQAVEKHTTVTAEQVVADQDSAKKATSGYIEAGGGAIKQAASIQLAGHGDEERWIVRTAFGEIHVLVARFVGGRRLRRARKAPAKNPGGLQQEAPEGHKQAATPEVTSRRSMPIFVKTLFGTTTIIKVAPSDTIRDVKELLEARLSVPIDSQRLIFHSKQLQDFRRIAYYGIREASTLHMVALLRGGMQAIWRCFCGAKSAKEEADVLGADPQLLQKMSLPALKKKARAMGCDEEAVNRVDATDDPREAAIKLVLAKKASANELVQLARRVMEQCMLDVPTPGVPKYTEPERIWSILERETQPVKLLRGTWVRTYASTDGRRTGFPRRQDLEKTWAKEAFLPREEVKCEEMAGAGKTMNIVSISYCWRAAEHPDKDGRQLRVVASKLEEGLLRHDATFRHYFKDAGIFWDFCSLHQKERTPEETKVFKEEALPSIDIWYQHSMAITYIVNAPVPEPHVNYESRGWTFFERSCAELLKPAFAGGSCAMWPMISEFRTSRRNFPLPPELFAEQMAHKRFTQSGDQELVVTVYTKSCMEALRGIQTMHFEDMKVQQHDGKRLASVLNHCCSLHNLVLTRTDIGDVEVQDIASVLPSMPSLQTLKLDNNKIGDAGATEIAKALPSMPSLQILRLDQNKIGDAGATEIAKALPSMQALKELLLIQNKIGDAGAIAISNALPRMQPHGQTGIFLGDNDIAEAGRTLLENAEQTCNGKVRISFAF